MKSDGSHWEHITTALPDECDYIYPIPRLSNGNFYRTPYKQKKCNRTARFHKGDEYRCGVHTPGVGPYRERKVQDSERANTLVSSGATLTNR